MEKLPNLNIKVPTAVGCGALLVWSLYALVISELSIHLPVFQTLFLMFGISFIAMSIRVTSLRKWHTLKQPWYIWLIGILGVCGSDMAYVTAVQYAPPAHVDFIDYLWPFLVIILSGFLPREKFSLQHIIAGGLGFLGVFLLLTGNEGFLGLKGDYIQGYCFALIAAIVWSTYTLVTRWRQEIPTEMVGMYCGVGSLISLLLHLRFEAWVMPTPFEGCLLLMLGLSSGFAYLFWSYATQKGNLKLLGVLAYFTPIMSMGFLVMSGAQAVSSGVILACLFVVSGVVVGSLDWSRVRGLVAGGKAS